MPSTLLFCYTSYCWAKKRISFFSISNGQGDSSSPVPTRRKKETVVAVTTLFESISRFFKL